MSKDSNKVLYYTITLIVIALIIISYLLGYNASNKSNTYNYINDTIVLKDTVIRTIYRKGELRIIKDTVWIKEYFEDSIKIASIDTLTSDSLYLSIDYYFPPINEFKIDYQLPVKTVLVYSKNEGNHNKIFFGIGGGLIFGSRGVDIGITIGVFYNF